jgi:hypothetical protein
VTPEQAPTDRGTWRLVARRDFWVRLRERSFLVSTLINIAVISILVLARASNVATAGPSYDLGYVGSSAIAEGAARSGRMRIPRSPFGFTRIPTRPPPTMRSAPEPSTPW